MSVPPPWGPRSSATNDDDDPEVRPGDKLSQASVANDGRPPASDDSDRYDTDPLPVANPYGAGWGSRWDPAPGFDAPDASKAEHFASSERFEPPPRSASPVLGDAELPSGPEPFAFPTAPSKAGGGSGARNALVGAAALAVVAGIGALIFWLVNRTPTSPEAEDAPAEATVAATTTTTTTVEAPRRNVEAETRLAGMLPPGYPPGACRPVDPKPGSVAMFNCAGNGDPGGPTSATYLLARDKSALDAAFTAAIRPDAVVICPGNIQSPGPWRRNATPDKISGMLVCGAPDNVPTVAWTHEERMLISVVRSDPPGPPLDQLYQWWSSHS